MLISAIGLGLLAATCAVAAEIKPIRIPLVRNQDGYGTRLRRSSLEKRQASPATQRLFNSYGREFLIEVEVGTPAQKFNVTLDTGSATLWVPSIDCPMLNCPYERFNASASSSAHATNETFQITYGVGMANGTYIQDSVTVAGLTIPNQVVGLAAQTEAIYGGMTEGYSNGIMGFGFPGMNSLRGHEQDVPFVFNLANNNLIPEALFSIYLNSRFEYGYSGEILLGGIDDSKYTGSLTYAPVPSYALSTSTGQLIQNLYLFWTLVGTGIQTSTGFNTNFADVTSFVLDTGTTLSYGPKDVTDQIAQSITGTSAQQIFDVFSGVYRVDCGFASRDDTVTFSVATNLNYPSNNPLNMTIPIRELILPMDGARTPEESKECFLGIAPMQDNHFSEVPFDYLLGESVLRSFYTVHDMGKRSIGIAPAAFVQSNNGANGGSDANGENAAGSNPIRSVGSVIMVAAIATAANMLF